MEKNDMDNSLAQAEKQLFHTWKSIMFLSGFTIFVGVGCMIWAGYQMLIGINIINAVIWILSGLGHIAIGCWGIHFSKEKEEALEDIQFIVRRGMENLGLGIIGYVFSIIFFVIAVFFAEISSVYFLLVSICENLMLFIVFFWFEMYREEKIIVIDKEIFVFNVWGKKRVINVNQIGQVCMSVNQACYLFLDRNENELFHMSTKMKGADRFLQEFIAKNIRTV